MKKFIKQNKIYILFFSISIVIMIISILGETNIFSIMKNYLFNSEYRHNFGSDLNLNSSVNIIQVIKIVLSNFTWTYDYMLIWGTNIFQTLLPCFCVIGGVIYYRKNRTINNFLLHKEKKYKHFLLMEAIKVSIKISLSFFASYICYYIFALIISHGAVNISIHRTLFSDLFGQQFYYNYTILYYLLDGIIRFLLVPFVYSFFACMISMRVKSEKYTFFIPLIYYFGLDFISYEAIKVFGNNGIYVSPVTIMLAGSYVSINTLLILFICILPIIVGLILFLGKTKNVEI